MPGNSKGASATPIHPPASSLKSDRDESDSESEKEEACLIFNPLEFGTAAEVSGLSPPLFSVDICQTATTFFQEPVVVCC